MGRVNSFAVVHNTASLAALRRCTLRNLWQTTAFKRAYFTFIAAYSVVSVVGGFGRLPGPCLRTLGDSYKQSWFDWLSECKAQLSEIAFLRLRTQVMYALCQKVILKRYLTIISVKQLTFKHFHDIHRFQPELYHFTKLRYSKCSKWPYATVATHMDWISSVSWTSWSNNSVQ